MSSYRQIIYHIVFRTKHNVPSLNKDNVDQLYAYIGGIIKRKNCHLYIINGIEDHIHILTGLHPSIALADYIKDIKVYTSMWMKESGLFPIFNGWAEGYGSFTCSYRESDFIIKYIKNQKEHHRRLPFVEEYRRLLNEHGIAIEERFFP